MWPQVLRGGGVRRWIVRAPFESRRYCSRRADLESARDRRASRDADPVVVHQDDGARAVLVVLQPGQELGEHQVRENAWVFVVDGLVEVASGTESAVVGAARSCGSSLRSATPSRRRPVPASCSCSPRGPAKAITRDVFPLLCARRLAQKLERLVENYSEGSSRTCLRGVDTHANLLVAAFRRSGGPPAPNPPAIRPANSGRPERRPQLKTSARGADGPGGPGLLAGRPGRNLRPSRPPAVCLAAPLPC